MAHYINCNAAEGLTFMSTLITLERLEREGKLIRFKLALKPREVEKRRLLLSASVHKWVAQEPNKKTAMEHHAAIYAQLAGFVIGKEVDDVNFFKQCIPFDDDIWTIRILFRPQCRIFGAFIGHDCFVGLHKADRDKLDFNEYVQKTKNLWDVLFPGIKRLRGIRFYDYVSNGGERDKRKTYN